MVYFSCFPKFVLLFLQLKRYSGLSRFSSVSVVIPRLQTVFTADVSYGNFPRVLPTLPVAVKSTRTSRRCARRAQQPVFALKQFLLKNWWNSLVFLGRRKTHSYIMLKSSTLFASISAFFVCSSKSHFLTTAELGLLLYLNCRLPWFSLPTCVPTSTLRELSESHRTMLLEGVSGNLLYGVLVILQHMRVCV